MKKIITILIICFFGNAYAQITETCATGTIKLKTQNHQYGTLEWQISQDGVKWDNIHDAHDTTYVFTTSKAAYYRAVNKFPSCDPIISSVTLVQRPPVANAGQDRLVNDVELYLGANTAIGSTGTWSVLEGTGGVLLNPNNPNTKFTGTTGSYKLLWTLQNSCGVSTDTLNVKFKSNQYHPKIVVVDNTDVLQSTPAQVINGDYIIQFASPVPVIDNQTILVGTVGNGYLRKVNSVTQTGNTFTMATSQGKLKDLFVDGGFELGNVFKIDTILPASRMTNFNRLSRIPTRAEILSNLNLRTGKHFFIVKDSVISPYNGISVQRVASTTTNPDNPEFHFTFNNTIVNQAGFNCHLNGGLTFTPNVYADFEKTLLHTTFNVGLNNATVVSNYQFSITNTTSTNLFDQDFSLYTYNRLVYFLIGGVPVLVNVGVDFNGKASAQVNTNLSFVHSFQNTVTTNAGLSYNDGVWSNHYNNTINTTVDNNLNISGDLTQNFEIGPKMTFMFYDIIGPYADAKLTEDLDICASTVNAGALNWKANLNLGAKFTLGARAEILENQIFDYSKTWEDRELYTVNFPYTIEYHSGNNQHYIYGTPMTNPIKVRVMSNKGFAVPGSVVKFEPFAGSGTVSTTYVVTDLDGYAQTSWSPTGTGVSKLSAIVQDCDQNNISNSPLIFQATETTSIDCTHTTLYADYAISGNTISPTAHMGVPPYTYSTDTINFSSIIPQITMTTGGNYSATVRDSNGCLAVMNYYNGAVNCNNSGLNVQLQSFGGNLYATANGGRPPYLYSLDNISSYTSNNVFSNLSVGYHTVFVKDANDCTKRSVTYITNSTTTTVAYFNINTATPLVGQSIQFNNLSNNATTYLWDFGDGTISTLTNPTKIYNAIGNYTVTLTAYNGTTQHVFQNNVNITYNSALAGCWKQVSAESHTLAIKNDGTLWAWGLNDNGQLGDGTLIEKHSPIQIGTDNNWKEVSAGQSHSLAIKNDGTLWAWGDNYQGELGNNSNINSSVPIQVTANTNWKSISAGSYYSIAIKNDGTLWSWGSNAYGQLGIGNFLDKSIPTQVGVATFWKSISAGGSQTIALKTDNTIWGFGLNKLGSLGLGNNNTNYLTPTQIGSGTNWKKISVSKDEFFYPFSIGIKNDGTIWSTGNNPNGQIGNGSNSNNVYSFTQIGTQNDWADVEAGASHSVALKNSGNIYSWGGNSEGQIGDGTTIDKFSPTLISTIEPIQKISCGLNNSFIINSSGNYYAFGSNVYGNLGNSSTTNSSTSITISCPN